MTLKNQTKFLSVVLALSIISGCEGENVLQQSSPSPAQVITQTDSTPVDQAHTDNPKTDNKLPNGSNAVSTTTTNNTYGNTNMLACEKVLEDRGQFSEKEGYVDYLSGFRIFPLLHFIMKKKSIPAQRPEQSAFMRDNPIFVTNHDKYANSILFATIHSKRTGVLHGSIGFPDNEVTSYYKAMVFGRGGQGGVPQVPSTDIAPRNKLVEVNRETWVNELKEYTEPCKGSLILPPTQTKPPFFKYNHAVHPFSKEIDFVAGAEGVGNGLMEDNKYSGKIIIPILLYCPGCKVENVVMIQNQVELQFTRDKYDRDWQDWLGPDWHLFSSEKIDIDEYAFQKAIFGRIHSELPPFISDYPSTIQVTINGEKVNYVNQ